MKLFLIVTLLFVSIGCAAHQVSLEAGCPIRINPSLESQVAKSVRVIVHSGQHTTAFNGQIELNVHGLTLVGLTPLNTRGLLIKAGAYGVTIEKHPFFRMPLAPARLLTLLEYSLLPRESLDAALRACAHLLEETSLPYPTRTIRAGSREIFREATFQSAEATVRLIEDPSSGIQIEFIEAND